MVSSTLFVCKNRESFFVLDEEPFRSETSTRHPKTTLADPRGVPGRAPSGSKFFRFHAVICKMIGLHTHFGSCPPPQGKSWIRHWTKPWFKARLHNYFWKHSNPCFPPFGFKKGVSLWWVLHLPNVIYLPYWQVTRSCWLFHVPDAETSNYWTSRPEVHPQRSVTTNTNPTWCVTETLALLTSSHWGIRIRYWNSRVIWIHCLQNGHWPWTLEWDRSPRWIMCQTGRLWTVELVHCPRKCWILYVTARLRPWTLEWQTR